MHYCISCLWRLAARLSVTRPGVAFAGVQNGRVVNVKYGGFGAKPKVIFFYPKVNASHQAALPCAT